jgi:hypothetical protein
MRQDKDRSGKWLLTHHGDAVLKLGGITGFTAWRALQPETVAPRRLPDGLIEVRFPDEAEPTWVLVEIETYPDRAADEQVLDDLMLIAVDRRVVPEVVSLVLKPKGNLTVAGTAERTSPRNRTRVGGSWPVVRVWELEAETLLAAGDAGLIPWVPLARSTLPAEELLTRCRDRLATVPDPVDRAGLMVVTQILAGLAFPDRRFLHLFGGPDVMIESPVLDEVKEILLKRGRVAESQRSSVAVLKARFGSVPEEVQTKLTGITDLTRLEALVPLAATCPDVAAFAAQL